MPSLTPLPQPTPVSISPKTPKSLGAGPGTPSALVTDSSEGAFLLTFPPTYTALAPQHILYSLTKECGVGQDLFLSPQEANPFPPPPAPYLGHFGERKWGLPISPRSSSVQPDISYINVLFCLFILVGGLSSLPHHPGPSPVWPWPPAPGSSWEGGP